MVGKANTTLSVIFSILFFGLTATQGLCGQDRGGYIKGQVVDKQTNYPISGATIWIGKSTSTSTTANGSFSIQISEDNYALSITANGYDTLKISKVSVYYGQAATLLFQMSSRSIDRSSTNKRDSALTKTPPLRSQQIKGAFSSNYNHSLNRKGNENASIENFPLQNSLDAGLMQSLQRLPLAYYDPNTQTSKFSSNPSIAGMDSRYSQIRLNGMAIQDLLGYPNIDFLNNFSADVLEKISVLYQGSSIAPGDRAGGTVDIQTKTNIDANFVLFGATAGIDNDFQNQSYYNSSTADTRWLGSPGKKNNLPENFPTTRSRYTLDQLNPQERIDRLKTLSNTIPLSSNTTKLPNWGFSLGMGRTYTFKKGRTFNAFLYVNQWKKQLNTVSDVQVLPNTRANPFPFTSSIPVARTVSTDSISNYRSGLNVVFNLGLHSNKANYNWQNTFIKSYESSYTQKSSVFKPDEDTLARNALIAEVRDLSLLLSQLSGEHLLNADKQFKLIWKASYAFGKESSPDTRNLLLQQAPGNSNFFQHAQQSTVSQQNQVVRSSNSGRSWSESNTHNFTGSIELKAPFRAFNLSQLLEGGVWFNAQYHNYFSDLYLYKRSNTSFNPIDSLLSPDNYYPTGIDVINFYNKLEASSLPFANDFSTIQNQNNFIQSQNTGSVFAQLTNNLTRAFRVTWGFRLETNSQLASNIQYQYTDFVKEPQKYTISLNSRINSIDFLPNIHIEYFLHKNITFQGGYNKTVTRPSLRELTRFLQYNPASFTYYQGNLALENTLQDHVYGGVTLKSVRGSYFETEVFYRLLNRPIESRITAVGIGLQAVTPYNMPTATIKGLRGSFQISLNDIVRSRFMESIHLFGSGVIQDSKVDAGPVKASEDVYEHKLTGTPDYIFNTGLTISDPRFPNISVSYQQIADHVKSIGTGSLITLQDGAILTEIPEMRIATQQSLNIQISQKLFKNALFIAAGARNLTGSTTIMYQDLNANKKFDSAVRARVSNGGAYAVEGTDLTFWNPAAIRSYYISISYNIR